MGQWPRQSNCEGLTSQLALHLQCLFSRRSKRPQWRKKFSMSFSSTIRFLQVIFAPHSLQRDVKLFRLRCDNFSQSFRKWPICDHSAVKFEACRNNSAHLCILRQFPSLAAIECQGRQRGGELLFLCRPSRAAATIWALCYRAPFLKRQEQSAPSEENWPNRKRINRSVHVGTRRSWVSSHLHLARMTAISAPRITGLFRFRSRIRQTTEESCERPAAFGLTLLPQSEIELALELVLLPKEGGGGGSLNLHFRVRARTGFSS